MEDHDSVKGKTETLILSKKDEQERVQRKTFTNWINTYLVQAHPPYKIDNLYESIKDGLCLIHLLEAMTGEKLRKEQPKNMQKIHRLSNINTALEFLKSRKIKLVNINATDIADGRPSIILGLMWTVILFFQIEEQEEILIGALGADYDGKLNAKTSLLNWVNKTIGDKYNLNVTDFGPSWRDGKAFNALVHNIDPSLVDWNGVKNKTNKENLQEAFKQAEQLGIPHLLDVQDVDVAKPDEKSIMTYITQFLKSYPEGGKEIEENIVATNNAKEEAALRAQEEELERQRLEEEERQKQEAEEREKERRRKEEEERKKREQEEKKRKEEEEKKRKEEEERKRKEEEEKKRKEEEERKRREAEERKRKEAEEKKRMEEEERKRREEAERKRKEEEERKRREEEERKRKEEAERKRKEEEERKRREEEERKRKEEAERKRKEEEKIKQEELARQKKLAEEEKRKKFKDHMDNMKKWVADLNTFLDDGLECDSDSICSYLENLSGLLSDKDLIDEDLTELKDDICSGKCGAEYSKPLSNEINEFEKKLKDSLSKANNIKNALNQNRDQLKICEKNMDQVADWINNLDKAMEDINDTRSPETFEQSLNKFKTNLYTEPTAVNSLKEVQEIFTKIKNSAPKNLKETQMQNKIKDLETKLKEKTEKGKAIDKSLKDFDKSLSKANDWQKDYEKKISNIGPLSNDISKLKQQLEKIENLKQLQKDGENIIQDAIEKGQVALTCSSEFEPIQAKINSNLENAENKWLQNTDTIENLKDEIMERLSKVEGVMQSGSKVDSWLKEKEADLKASKGPCDSLTQKIAKIDDLKKLLNEIESEWPIIEDYLNQLQEIAQTDPNALRKLNQTKQQLSNLQTNIKDAIKDAENNVKNHQDFDNKMNGASEWLEMAKALKLDATSKETPGSIEEMKRRKDIIEKLIESKSNGENLVKAAVTSGEIVAKETSLKGKEEILNGVRGLNKGFLDLLDGLGAAKQSLEMKLAKASNINRDLDALVNWAEEFENKLFNITDSDLDKIKLLCDDAQAKSYLAENLVNQTKLMNDPEFQSRAENIKELVKHNLENAQQMYSQIRENLQAYNGLINNCKNMDSWLNEAEKKMARLGETSGYSPDDLAKNLSLLEKLAEDVKEKRNYIEKINNQGRDLTDSSPSKGKETNALLDKINNKHKKLMENLEDKNQEVRRNIEDQKEFDESIHKAQQWMNDATQKLLKYSDIKQCSPTQIDSFSRNFENIVDSVPYGEEIVSSTIYTGQKHLEHLRQSKRQDSNNYERDQKRINDLEKNWGDFQKQIDLVNKNVHRVKDSLDEFNLLKNKLEEFITEKENGMKELPSVEILKYIINELDDSINDLDKLQTKAVEVGGSLNYPSAIMVAKGITDRYQNMKKNLESELNKSKQLENDWNAYKNALNVCEKWIVDTGFRIIENDYSAYSPEDAQVRLEEYSKLCDQIQSFGEEVNKVVKIGKQLASKLPKDQKPDSNSMNFSSHSEPEIHADIENLQRSHKNLVENANQTKSRLIEQLDNWRKYRDLVQVNDKYLTNDLTDWWRNKKYFPPQNFKDVDENIREAEEILRVLNDKQNEMKMTKSNCDSLSSENGPRNFSATAEINRKRKISSTTPLSRLAESVETGLEKNIEEIKKYIPELENLLKEWQSFDKDTAEFEIWINEKEQMFESTIGKPSMKSTCLTDKQRTFGEQLKKEIDGQEKHINDLLEKARVVGSRKINPLLKRIEDLKRQLKKLLERKDEEIDAVDFDYVDKQTVGCQNNEMQLNLSETIATQTLPEKYNISTSTEPRTRKTKVQTFKQDFIVPVNANNVFGLRNSGGNRGLSKMLYPYCCTSDLLNQKLHLDYVHGSRLKNNQKSFIPNAPTRPIDGGKYPPRLGISKVRSAAEESVRRNWMTQDSI